MDRDRMEAQWKQVKGQVRKGWGRGTGSERESGQGERDRQPGKWQKTFGILQDEARQQIRELRARY